MPIKLSRLKASHFLSLAVLTVSLVGVNGLICNASLAGGLNQNGQSIHDSDTGSQFFLNSGNTEIIDSEVVNPDNLASLNSSVPITESSSVIPLLIAGAFLLKYKSKRNAFN